MYYVQYNACLTAKISINMPALKVMKTGSYLAVTHPTYVCEECHIVLDASSV